MSCYRHIIQCMTFLKTSFIASVVSVQTGSYDDEVIQILFRVFKMENRTNRACGQTKQISILSCVPSVLQDGNECAVFISCRVHRPNNIPDVLVQTPAPQKLPRVVFADGASPSLNC